MIDFEAAFGPFPLPWIVTVLEWRKDGWPLCPLCGDDELYSLEIPATAETIRACYRCGRLTLVNPKPPPEG